MLIDEEVGENTDKQYNFNAVKLFKPVDSLKINNDRIGDNNMPT
jgi:hypothetical protein